MFPRPRYLVTFYLVTLRGAYALTPLFTSRFVKIPVRRLFG